MSSCSILPLPLTQVLYVVLAVTVTLPSPDRCLLITLPPNTLYFVTIAGLRVPCLTFRLTLSDYRNLSTGPMAFKMASRTNDLSTNTWLRGSPSGISFEFGFFAT